MSVQILTGHWISGQPTMDYKIAVNGVTIGLTKDDFQELTIALSAEIAADYEKMLQVAVKHDKRIAEVRKFRKDIFNLFFSGDDEDDMVFTKSVKDVKQDDLVAMLEKYDKFLGFM